jgi:lysosomal alpha-mannosidase
LIDYIEDYSNHFATDQLFVLFGSDFRYQNAFQNYENMDKMIDYMNENYGEKYIFKYSTPSEYIDAINSIEDQVWPTKYQDGVPYGDN